MTYGGYTESEWKRQDRKQRIKLASILNTDWYGRSIDEMFDNADIADISDIYPRADCTCSGDDLCSVCRKARRENNEIPY